MCTFVVRSFVRDAGAAPVCVVRDGSFFGSVCCFSVRVFCHECVCCYFPSAFFFLLVELLEENCLVIMERSKSLNKPRFLW